MSGLLPRDFPVMSAAGASAGSPAPIAGLPACVARFQFCGALYQVALAACSNGFACELLVNVAALDEK